MFVRAVREPPLHFKIYAKFSLSMNKTPIDLPNVFHQAQTIPTRDKQAQATAHLRHAKALGKIEAWADALQHVSKALDCVPELVDDKRLQTFVGRMTKQDGKRMTHKLANPTTRAEVYRLLNQVITDKTQASHQPTRDTDSADYLCIGELSPRQQSTMGHGDSRRVPTQ